GLGVSLFATACGGWLLHTSRTVGVMLICLILWSVLLILFSLTYALLSLLEYLSFYKKQLISGAPLLTLYFVLFCRGSYTVISAWIVKSNQTMVTQLMTLNYFAFLPLCAGFWLVLFLLYYHHEYYTATKDRLFHIGMLLMLVAEALGSFSDFVLTLIQTTLLPRLLSDISLHLLFADLNLWHLLLTYLTFLVGFVLAIAGPVRHTRAKKGYLWGAAMLLALTLTLEFVFNTQYYGTWQYLISSLIWLLLYTYLFCFLLLLSRQPTITEN
ncbi:MAG: hypothetical protein IJF45_03090, partial [Clostridia bacterium]|nr:hypothetical protein [Clostridia bacterium]